MSGGNISVLENDGVRSVWSICADEASEEVHWLDYVRHIIVSIKFNGQHKKVNNFFFSILRKNKSSKTA